MTPAEKIMNKKSLIKDELNKYCSESQSNQIWQDAADQLDAVLKRYADLPKGVHMHTNERIFPAACIYLCTKEVIGEEKAYHVIEDAAIRATAGIGNTLAKLLKLPGMKSVFVKAWDPVSKRMFGSSSGFTNVFYPKKKGEYRMDIIACPYAKYFSELGCPELTKIFCENDERTYGNLPGIKFRRTGTLGKGASRCDFYIRKLQ